MTYPNLFIIGAPKSGTTSLAYWLSQHNEIFFPLLGDNNTKMEPHYWAKDLNIPGKIFANEDYIKLYPKNPKYKILGDASVWYFISKTAIELIESNIKNPKYIFCIRNPADLVYSLWLHYIRIGWELVTDDFIYAFELSEQRSKGKLIGVNTKVINEPILLNYKYIGLLGLHLERLLKKIPKERIFIIVFEELIKNPEKVWMDLMEFLELTPVSAPPFPRKNIAKTFKNPFLYKLFLQFINFLQATYGIRKKLGLVNTGISRKISQKFLKEYNYKKNNSIRKYLLDFYREDIEKIESLLNINLQSWKL